MQEEKLKDLSVQPVPALLSHPILAFSRSESCSPVPLQVETFLPFFFFLLVPAALVEPFPSSPVEVERSRRCSGPRCSSGCSKAR